MNLFEKVFMKQNRHNLEYWDMGEEILILVEWKLKLSAGVSVINIWAKIIT